MGISKNYQRALAICDEFQEFEILEYIKGKSPKLKLQCKQCGHIFERYQSHFIDSPHLCPKCHPKGTNQIITLEEGQRRIDVWYGENHLKMLEYKGNNVKTKIQCMKCGYIFDSVPTSLWRGRLKGCPSCEKTLSLGESRLEKYFRENNIEFRSQERFKECRDKLMLPFDFYLPKYNTCVEFQGEQHYKENSYYYRDSVKIHDKIKANFCESHNIQLILIPYWDIDKIPSYFKFTQE